MFGTVRVAVAACSNILLKDSKIVYVCSRFLCVLLHFWPSLDPPVIYINLSLSCGDIPFMVLYMLTLHVMVHFFRSFESVTINFLIQYV